MIEIIIIYLIFDFTKYILRKNSALMNKLMDVDRNTKLDVVGDILTLLEACVVPLVIIILYIPIM